MLEQCSTLQIAVVGQKERFSFGLLRKKYTFIQMKLFKFPDFDSKETSHENNGKKSGHLVEKNGRNPGIRSIKCVPSYDLNTIQNRKPFGGLCPKHSLSKYFY